MKKAISLISWAILVFATIGHSQNSVLSTGNWVKIAIYNTGIQKITYSDLQSYGIDPAQINPKHLRLYGNGNGMLPEDSDEFRYDDLQENAIYVSGEDDGVFNPDEYILFYAAGPTKWKWNEDKELFEPEHNIYSDYTCFFLTTDLGEGERIGEQVLSSLPPTYTSTTFNDYYSHDLDMENLIHSGKEWYGERFEQVLEYNFQTEFPGLINTEPLIFGVRTAARSTETSTFNFTINSQPVLSYNIQGFPFSTFADYAKTRFDTAMFYSNSSIINLSIAYNKPSDSSIGWLDYFTFNVRRQNIYQSGQLQFRDAKSVSPGAVTKFQFSTTNPAFNIWNVTDPLNPKDINYSSSNGFAEFTLETDSLTEFIIFDNSEFYTPVFIGNVENQNLHGIDPPDMIIIAYKDFIGEAQQLADFRENFDGISTFVTTPEKIYNEFSSGIQDVTAIRDFIKHMYDKSNGETPKYLLLFGDASYDYKSISKNVTSFVPTWETQNSLHYINSYCTDDFYCEVEDMIQTGIGRLPAKSNHEASNIVEKIIFYSSNEEAMGNWRNETLSIADDEDNNLHLNNAEKIYTIFDTTDRNFNFSKIYLDAYVQDTLPNGNPGYTMVNNIIADKINSGVNIINYIGHGFYNSLAHEQILTEADMANWENSTAYPLLFTATCSFGQFDDPDKYSISEQAILMKDRGMAAVIAPVRPTYSSGNSTLQRAFFSELLSNPDFPIGEVLKLAKQEINAVNTRKYCLFADPSMRLSIPDYNIVTEAVNGVPATTPPDTLHPGEKIIATGFLTDQDGNKIYDFNGSMTVKVFDRAKTVHTLGNDTGSIVTDFTVQDSVILETGTTIANGQFIVEFNLPSDIAQNYGTIKLSYYAEDALKDARGYYNDIVVGGEPNSTEEFNRMDYGLKFYPTIVSDRLFYTSQQNIENLEIDIMDIRGQILLSTIVNGLYKGEQKYINVSELPKGLYIIRAGNSNRIGNFKIVKQ